MLAGVADCRRSRKWAAKEDGNWDLNLGPAAIGKERPCGSEGKKRPCSSEGRSRPRGSEVNRGPHGSEVNRENHEVLRGKEKDHAVLKESKEDHEVLECSFLPCGLGSRRDFAGKKRG